MAVEPRRPRAALDVSSKYSSAPCSSPSDASGRVRPETAGRRSPPNWKICIESTHLSLFAPCGLDLPIALADKAPRAFA